MTKNGPTKIILEGTFSILDHFPSAHSSGSLFLSAPPTFPSIKAHTVHLCPAPSHQWMTVPFPIQSTWQSSLIINIPRAYTYLHVVFYKSNYYKILIRQKVSKNLKLFFGVWSIFKLATGGRCALREPSTPTSSTSRHHPYQVLLPVISPSLSVDRSNPSWRVLPISLMFLCHMWPYRKYIATKFRI